MDTGKNMTSGKKRARASFDDQLFLLNFIICSYIGPDVRSDTPRCSWFERSAKSSPPYTLANLNSSFLRVSHLQRLYYSALRNANSDLIFDLDMFYMYLNGVLPLPSSGSVGDHRQFTSFFPLELHRHRKFGNCEIIYGIVLIDDPDKAYVKVEDLERFKSLSGVKEYLIIDRYELRGFPSESEDDTESESSSNSDEECEEADSTTKSKA
ncbi:hypothetical protein M5689_019616 [Euphorbia peplus]|nr:hypothetical protein M5689_019616 [Euphorbia peplus]